jgi:hypothetical protein
METKDSGIKEGEDNSVRACHNLTIKTMKNLHSIMILSDTDR